MAIRSIKSYESDMKFRTLPQKNDPRFKDDLHKYAIHYLSAMLNSYTNGRTEIKYRSGELDMLDLYFKGLQGNTVVKEKLLRKGKDGRFHGRMKDVFDSIDILPEMLDIVSAINSRSSYDINSYAIDSLSKEAKKLEMSISKFIVNSRTQNFLKFMGIRPQSTLTDEEIATFNESDIEVIYETGGVQLPVEIQAIAACNVSKMASGHKEVEDQCTEDLIKWAITAVRPYIDYSSATVKYRNVDVRNLIIPKSKYKDFRDITKFFEMRWMSIVDIKRECPSIRQDQLREIIEGGFQYNPEFAHASGELDSYFHMENNIFDDVLVPVMDGQWLADENEVHFSMPTSTGGEIYKKVKDDYVLDRKDEKKGAELNKKTYTFKYCAKWIVGSDILLTCKKSENVKYKGRKGNRIPEIDISIIKTGKKSLVKRSKTIVDDFNVAAAKLRNAINTLPPAPRMIVYQHALRNIKLNGILQKPRDLIDSFLQEGILVANGQDEEGNFIFANGGKAVDFLPSGLAEDITIFSNEMAAKIQLLRQVLGLPEGLDGTAGNPYTGVGQTQLAAQSSSNALYPTLSRIQPLFERIFNLGVGLWQCLCSEEDIEVDELSISEDSYNILKLTKDFSMAELNIKFVFAPTDQEKADLLTYIKEMSLAYVQSQGQVGYNRAEYFLLYRLINANRINEAAYMIARIDKQKDKMKALSQQAAIEATAQQQQQSATATAEEERKTIDYKTNKEIEKDFVSETLKAVGQVNIDYLKSQETEKRGIPENNYLELKDRLMQEIAPILGKILAESQPQQIPQEGQPPQAQAPPQEQMQLA